MTPWLNTTAKVPGETQELCSNENQLPAEVVAAVAVHWALPVRFRACINGNTLLPTVYPAESEDGLTAMALMLKVTAMDGLVDEEPPATAILPVSVPAESPVG